MPTFGHYLLILAATQRQAMTSFESLGFHTPGKQSLTLDRICLFLLFSFVDLPLHLAPFLPCGGREGLLHGWVQQNHDGLPQKAGFPQERINEIHGSWYDPGNPATSPDLGERQGQDGHEAVAPAIDIRWKYPLKIMSTSFKFAGYLCSANLQVVGFLQLQRKGVDNKLVSHSYYKFLLQLGFSVDFFVSALCLMQLR